MSGYQLMIAGDVFVGVISRASRSRSRSPANTALHYKIPFPANDHTFKKGHRIMVQVQSTWFPVIDRNPQTCIQTFSLGAQTSAH